MSTNGRDSLTMSLGTEHITFEGMMMMMMMLLEQEQQLLEQEAKQEATLRTEVSRVRVSNNKKNRVKEAIAVIG